MKARRLIEQNGKYNIVYFGSCGIKEKYKSIEGLRTDSVINLNPCSKNNIDHNLHFRIQSITEPTSLIVKIQFKYLQNNDWLNDEIEQSFSTFDGPLDDNFWDVTWDISEIFTLYNTTRSFTLTVLEVNPNNLILDYFENAGDLVYTPEPNNVQRNAPNYKEVVSVGYSYSSKQEGVRDSLIPRLGIIKGELWYRKSYGLPLLDKIKSKGIFDSIIVGYIMDHPDVVGLDEFTSKLDGHSYKYDCKINTIYNEETILSNKI